MTRMQQIENAGRTPDLPPIGAAGHLVGYLFDAGPVSHGSMGPVPLSHADLAAWQANTGIELQAWEARGLRKLSTAYVAASQDAQQADCPPFYIEKPANDHRQAVSDGVRSIFGARAQAARKDH